MNAIFCTKIILIIILIYFTNYPILFYIIYILASPHWTQINLYHVY